MSNLQPEVKRRHELLKADVQAALRQAEQGLCKPLDMDSVRKKLTDEIDEQGRPK